MMLKVKLTSLIALADIANMCLQTDIKDAYYSILISPEHQKYLSLFTRENYQFTCFSSGLCSGRRRVTYILKASLATLKKCRDFVITLARSLVLHSIKIYECVALLDSLGYYNTMH